MTMGKAIFIIPYFGRFNNYFQLFLNSCAYNDDFNWLIITDDNRPFIYPNNVKKIYMTFEELKTKIQVKFDFHIALNTPYKLCDFKPAYGYIFEDYIKEYEMWGHCDTDLIFGKINAFISDEKMNYYDKIGILGHCTLYKNNRNNNRMFMRCLNNELRYKTVYQNSRNYSFDEEFNLSVNNIFENENKKILYDEYEANIYTKSSNFIITKMNVKTKKYENEKRKDAFFIFDKGRLYRVINGGRLKEEEYMYIHLQSRKMDVNLNDKMNDRYKIIPNAFDDIEVDVIDVNNIGDIKKKHFNTHYFRLRTSNLYKKIKKAIKG